MELQIIKELPKLNSHAIERAVEQFIEDSRVENVDKIGMYNQTIESIAQATMFSMNNAQHFWLAHDGFEVKAYVLAHIGKDIDNRLTYTVSQAWAHPSLRRTPKIKEWWQLIRNEAKRNMCKHVLIPSSRHVKAYLRFLGKNYHEYVTLIKEDI